MSNIFLRALRRKGGRRGLKRKSRRQRGAASSRGSSCGGGFVAGGFRPTRDEVLVERLRNYREWLEGQKDGKAVWESIFEPLMLEVQRQLLRGTADRTFRKWLQAFMSMKAWNKLMHALNGNILPVGWTDVDDVRHGILVVRNHCRDNHVAPDVFEDLKYLVMDTIPMPSLQLGEAGPDEWANFSFIEMFSRIFGYVDDISRLYTFHLVDDYIFDPEELLHVLKDMFYSQPRYGDCDVPRLDELVSNIGEKGNAFAAMEVILRFIFFSWDDISVHGLLSDDPESVELQAQIIADFVSAGFDELLVQHSLRAEIATVGFDKSTLSNKSYLTAKTIFEGYMAFREHAFVLLERFDLWLDWFKYYIIEHNIVPLFLVTAIIDFATKLTAHMSRGVAVVVGAIIEFADQVSQDNHVVRTLGAVMYSLLDVVDVQHRTNPKPVWALLIKSQKGRLPPSLMRLIDAQVTSYQTPVSYNNWAGFMIGKLNDAGADVGRLSALPPTRGLFYPTSTFGNPDSMDYIKGFEVAIRKTKFEENRIRQAIMGDAPLGIDAAWTATAESMGASLNRYTVPRPVMPIEVKAKIHEAADALFDDYPELYDRPASMSVAAVMAATEWKYSAGLPFIPAIKKRQELKNSPWYGHIRIAVDNILSSTEWPGVALHGFPKNQVVTLEKIIKDPAAMRTVTAGDRLTAIAVNTRMMEVSKRPPSMDSYVVNMIPRREGALQPVFEHLAKKPYQYAGDAFRFDSTVPDEVATIGSVRLYERGVEGWWNERALVSFVEAYYQSLCRGLIVNLYDGTVITKTGGGGTGSAQTSANNRDWVRIILRASFSLCYHMPCSDYLAHVNETNAADDIRVSIDDEIEARDPGLREWAATMLSEFGITFTFSKAGVGDPYLHLKPLLPSEIDPDMYNGVHVDVPDYPLSHDPQRLLTVRSEHRADRMKGNPIVQAHVIVAQDVSHLMLTAHNPFLYHDIVEEWIDASDQFLRCVFDTVEFRLDYNEDGTRIVHAAVELVSGFSKRLIKQSRYGGRRTKIVRDGWLNAQADAARNWIKSSRIKSYREVFYLWVKPEVPDRVTPSALKYYKIRGSIPYFSDVFDALRRVRNVIFKLEDIVPKALLRAEPEDTSIILSRPFLTNSMVVERFIYMQFVYREKRVPTDSEMFQLIRISPFAGACDGLAFCLALRDPAFRQMLARYEPIDRDRTTMRMLWFCIIYSSIDFIIARLLQLRVFGTALLFFFLVVRDLDWLYAILGLCYWLGTGTASQYISNMMPRDKYLVQKQVAAVCTQLVPTFLDNVIPGIHSFSQFLPAAVLALSAGYKAKIVASGAAYRVLTGQSNRWAMPVRQIMESWTKWGDLAVVQPIVMVVAGVGTGKSTSLYATFFDMSPINRIFSVVPTNLMVGAYKNPFVAPDNIHRVFAGDPIPPFQRGQVIVMTAGYFSVISSEITTIGQNDLVVIDEPHYDQTEQHLAYVFCQMMQLQRGPRILLTTATPRGRLCRNFIGRSLEVPGERRFVTERYPIELPDPRFISRPDMSQLVSTTLSIVPADARVLVHHPSLEVCHDIASGMRAIARQCTVVSSMSPVVPSEGSIVATSIVEVGVNIDPPADVLLTFGVGLIPQPRSRVGATGFSVRTDSFDAYYELVQQPLTQAQFTQLCGRVGREKEAIIFSPSFAGMGNEGVVIDNPVPILADWGKLTLLKQTMVLEVRIVPEHPSPHNILDFFVFKDDIQRHEIARAQRAAMMLALASSLNGWNHAVEAVENYRINPEADRAIKYIDRFAQRLGWYSFLSRSGIQSYRVDAQMVGLRYQYNNQQTIIWGAYPICCNSILTHCFDYNVR